MKNITQSSIIEVLISLTLIYALLSIFVSLLIEWWNSKRRTRQTMLQNAINQLLKDSLNLDYGALFYNHHMIAGLKNPESNRLPQYISSSMFAEAFVDVMAAQAIHTQKIRLSETNDKGKQYELEGDSPPENVIDRFQVAVKAMNTSPLKDALQSFIDKSMVKDVDGKKVLDYPTLKKNLEIWYNDYMERVGGWYKAKLKRKQYVFGFLVALLLNVDSLHLVKVISMDDSLRNSLVATAEKVADNYQKTADSLKSDNGVLLKVISSGIDSIKLKENLKDPIIKTKLAKLDSNFITKKAKMVLINDSISAKTISQTDSLLGIAASLNIPIGWSTKTAPLSWSWKKKLMGCGCNVKCTHKKGPGLQAYLDYRNHCTTWWNLFWYILGISISGVALSFGAPFWFDMMIKLVNIRRSGAKPQPSKDKE